MSSSRKVFMFPWLAYGHISPHLELAKKLSDTGFSIYLCSTPINLGFIKKKITQKYYSSIHLVEIHLQETPELPAFYHTTNGLPPHLMSTLTNALKRAKPNLSNILKSIEPDLIIYDVLQMWTAGLASTLNIPAVKFTTSSVAAFSYLLHRFINPGQEFPFPAIYVSDIEQARIFRYAETASKAEDEDSSTDHHPEDDDQEVPKRFCDSILIVRSCGEIEGKYMKYLSDMTMMKVVSVGPLFQDPGENLEDEKNDELIQWLGGKSECSSVFVSFGSEYFLTKEDLVEIAFGLELSNVNFIWVVRFPVGEKMRPEEALPEGFLERVKGRGRIVEGWAPQAEILRHPSIGGFVCHCGWSSVLESIEFGVPIIAIPMNLDQPINARLAVEVGAAVEVVRGENQRLQRDVIAQVIRDVVVGNVGEDLRRNLRDLSQKMQSSEKGELDESVDLLTQLCGDQ
ncbi:hypothetical protein ACH5RR_016460 [Cinchona calisaya]|uniref:Glycosyltransferase n=1 Tax=Cinchona calisaya TaxID=153742 RepID=A0ABD2ZW14_9GENT